MFTVAIIGRPNVGKSTLFNRLAGKRLALVDDRPGVTRDRREGEGKLGDLAFRIIDTAGLEEGDAASLSGRMRAQTEAAINLADLIFFVFDARAGLTPADRFFAKLLHRANKPLILVANKAEGRTGAAGVLEGFDLGLGEPVPLSAEHGDGFAELYGAFCEALPESTRLPVAEEKETAAGVEFGEEEDGSELDVTKPLKIAIIGRPNAGKSTLLNKILGEDRLLTGPEPGLTRDTIRVDLDWGDR
ncbi:MAG TPA: GTPase, partial [Methylocella sp.]|nr:GTPase [Methylocella sp.]